VLAPSVSDRVEELRDPPRHGKLRPNPKHEWCVGGERTPGAGTRLAGGPGHPLLGGTVRAFRPGIAEASGDPPRPPLLPAMPLPSSPRAEAQPTWIDETEDARRADLDHACAAGLTIVAATGVAP
jgi:hypothetical protein